MRRLFVILFAFGLCAAEAPRGYPRIAQFFYQRSPSSIDSLELLARYDLLVVSEYFDSGAIKQVLSINPDIAIVLYRHYMGTKVDYISWGSPPDWSWFLYTAPATLVDSVGEDTPFFRVDNPSYFRDPDDWYGDLPYQLVYQYVRIDSEIARIDSVRGDTLFVARSPGWRFPHAAGSQVRGIDSPWNGLLQMNFTLQCPLGIDSCRWCDWVIRKSMAKLLKRISGGRWMYAGLYYDQWNRVISDRAALVGNSFDFDMDGFPDYGGDSASVDSAWYEGIRWTVDSLRRAINSSEDPDRYLICNSESGLADYFNGRQFEAFPHQQTGGMHSTGGFRDNFRLFMEWSDSLGDDSEPRPMPRMNIIRPRCAIDDTAYIRFALACCLMGDGYISRGEPTGFVPASEIAWYDEYSVDTLTGCADTTGAHKHWLGMPVEPPQPLRPDSTVWLRRFERGIAVMAWIPEESTGVTVELGREYMHIKRVLYPTPLDSTVVTQVTLGHRVGQVGRGVVLMIPPGSPHNVVEGALDGSSEPVVEVRPNPFNSSCAITVPPGAEVKIYDLRGRVVAAPSGAGESPKVVWTPTEDIPPGVYLVRAICGGGKAVLKKVVYVR